MKPETCPLLPPRLRRKFARKAQKILSHRLPILHPKEETGTILPFDGPKPSTAHDHDLVTPLVAVALVVVGALIGIWKVSSGGGNTTVVAESETRRSHVSSSGSREMNGEMKTIEQIFGGLQKHRIEQARDALWKFVVAPGSAETDRIVLTGSSDASILRHFASRVEPDTVSIEPTHCWQDEMDELVSALMVKTNFNPEGFMVEMRSNRDGRHQISVERYLQFHFRAFQQFIEARPLNNGTCYYLTIKRCHLFEGDQRPSRTESLPLLVSGENPNTSWTHAFIAPGELADQLSENVPWNTNMPVRAVVEYRANPNDLSESHLFITDVIAYDWEGNLEPSPFLASD